MESVDEMNMWRIPPLLTRAITNASNNVTEQPFPNGVLPRLIDGLWQTLIQTMAAVHVRSEARGRVYLYNLGEL